MDQPLPSRTIALLGIGHTNAHVLRMWRMKPRPQTQLVCISNFEEATYSGMLPGVLAGQYPPDRMQIDLVRLCAANQARLITDRVKTVDAQRRLVLFHDRPELPFDVLSIGIGSVPTGNGVTLSDDMVLPIKPMQTFLSRLHRRMEQQLEPGAPLRVVVVGGGAGGVEISFCLPAAVRRKWPHAKIELTIVHGGEVLVAGMRAKTQAAVLEEFHNRQVQVLLQRRAVQVGGGRVVLDDGTELPADLVLWATSASPPPLLDAIDLPKDEDGFLAIDQYLRTTADAPIFVVGDSGTLMSSPTPKAGVYAVREGPVLWQNIHRLLDNRPLTVFEPQADFLKLLNTGDGRAIAEYKGLTLHNRWCWRWKDWIDGRFMDKYQDYKPMEMSSNGDGSPPPAMRCAGCGGKISGSVLSRVLSRLQIPKHPAVLLGLDQPDDAAVVQTTGGGPVTVTVDFFAAPLDDPYVVGRIAALNAASDAFAMGTRPMAALAMITMPVGPERAQEQLLYELLAGSLDEFRKMGATLVGGHTIEGPRLTIGYTVLAEQPQRTPRTKGRLQDGDLLVLTKPVGTGVLLAAHMQADCRADWMRALRQMMLTSNQQAAELMDALQIEAVTDVTGFGLAGHLLEMLKPGDWAAHLNLAALPLLPGFRELASRGIASTLAPANRAAEVAIAVKEATRNQIAYQALFDPQTCGGLLMAVRPERVDQLLESLHGGEYPEATVIGRIGRRSESSASLIIEHRAEVIASRSPATTTPAVDPAASPTNAETG